MGDFMRHDRRGFRGVARKREQPARDVKIAGRKREGVHHRRIQNCHLISGLARRIARAGELGQNSVEIALGGERFVFAAKLRHQLLVLNGAAVVRARSGRARRRQRRGE